ncbi:tripartite motif-containing protein 2-like [Branchiostoma floridae]|uniref:RING-type E3 ubiquitin transferase n=1 Tax=Branchiostoma floridae TaxID=7739 RepID=A0A9J7MDA7_BRAFL|nr:tripartite motif-containing protein 2-like [Branchiostoma floridae]
MASKIPDSHNFDEQFLTCPVCMLHFRDPRVLPCLHTFCRECLQEWATKQQPLECPTCRTQVSLPDKGVDGLRTNFYVNNLLDFAAVKKGAGPGVACQVCEGKEEGARSWCVQCAVLLCESCTNTHRRFPAMKGHQIVTQENLEASEGVPGSFQRKAFCPKHEDQVLTFYCEPCQTLVCVACTVVNHSRGDKRNPVEIGSVAERKKRDLQKLLAKVEPREKDVRDTLNEVDRESSQLPTSADAAIEQATGYFDQLIALLQDRKKEVVQEIVSRRQEVGKCLETQKEAMEFELAGLTSASEFCKQALEHGSDVHVIEVEGQARQRVDELLTTPSDLRARPSQVVFSEGTAVAEFRDGVARAGRVQVRNTGKVDVFKCSVEVKPAVVDFSNVSLLRTIDEMGRLCAVAKDDVTATLTDPSGQAVPTQLQEKGRGLWEISYSPEVTGNHGLEVKVNGGSVAGSPFEVRVQSRDTPVLTIGREGSGEGELVCPADVAVDMDGNIAVVDNGNNRVQIFDAKTGQSLRSFPVDGESPWGIDLDSNGQFIVTFDNNLFSTGNQAIRVYSREGKLTKTLKPDCLWNPCGVAVLQDGRIVVTDYTQQCCFLLQPDGSLIRDIGKGQLQHPQFIAVDKSRDMLFVTDYLAHKVFVFDLEGKLKFSFGKLGQDEGQLYHPTGITVDPAGNIVVVNERDRRLQVFGPDGTYLRTVTTVKGRCPQRIALTPDNHIAVACYMGDCVELYRYK